MESEEFEKIEGGRFKIRVWPNGLDGDDKVNMTISILNNNGVNATVHEKRWIEDENGDQNYTRGMKRCFVIE